MNAATKNDPLAPDERVLLRKRAAVGICAFMPEEERLAAGFVARQLIEPVPGEFLHISTGRTLRFDGAPFNILKALPIFKVTRAGQEALDWKP